MEINGNRLLDLPPETVWEGLLDTRVLQASIPGCESVVEVSDGVYDAVVLASVGPVRARFKGRIKQRDLVKPSRYELDFEGDSGMAGRASGSAVVTLEPKGDNGQQTLLTYRAESQIGGRLAQIGSRLIDATVARMSNQFFDRFQQVVQNPALLDPAAAPSDTAAAPVTDATPAPAIAAPAAMSVRQADGVNISMPSWVFIASLGIVALLIGWLAAC